MQEDWGLLNDVLAGERRMKDAGEKYCPKLSDQNFNDYEAYIQRGTFFNATARTVQGYVGAIVRKTPKVTKAPKQIEGYLNDFTAERRTFQEAVKNCLNEILGPGYFGVLCQITDTGRPYIAEYKAPDIINFWREKIDGEWILTRLTLQESYEISNPEDFYIPRTRHQIRELYLKEVTGIKRVFVQL